ncbi:substrate-binding periplasmic protein [Terasakiella pusilla]|uniref:substrate-binding periplasmic protein n=1 Tax=Terasakiella pusilla TaxID=64973 RepID=UPI003AA8F970
MYRLLLGIIFSCAMHLSANATTLQGVSIRFCGDGSGWPPYTYMDRHEPGIVKGYDVDVIHEILDPLGIELEVHFPSWKQCLERTADGHAFQVALSASFEQSRTEHFIYTRSYYRTQQHYFYARDRFETAPVVKRAEDLLRYGSVCGRYSYNYEGAGQLKNTDIKRVAKSYSALVARTLNGDCAFFIGRPSVLKGFRLVGENLIDNDLLAHAPVPDAKPDYFYMLISKNTPYANELKTILDDGIKRLQENGRLTAILQKYQKMVGN